MQSQIKPLLLLLYGLYSLSSNQQLLGISRCLLKVLQKRYLNAYSWVHPVGIWVPFLAVPVIQVWRGPMTAYSAGRQSTSGKRANSDFPSQGWKILIGWLELGCRNLTNQITLTAQLKFPDISLTTQSTVFSSVYAVILQYSFSSF